jgi:hypothetical protein
MVWCSLWRNTHCWFCSKCSLLSSVHTLQKWSSQLGTFAQISNGWQWPRGRVVQKKNQQGKLTPSTLVWEQPSRSFYPQIPYHACWHILFVKLRGILGLEGLILYILQSPEIFGASYFSRYRQTDKDKLLFTQCDSKYGVRKKVWILVSPAAKLEIVEMVDDRGMW